MKFKCEQCGKIFPTSGTTINLAIYFPVEDRMDIKHSEKEEGPITAITMVCKACLDDLGFSGDPEEED